MLPLGFANTARVTGESLMLGTMGAVTGGLSYGKGRDAGLSPARAIPYAVEDAAAEIITEKYLGAAGLLKNIKAGSSAGKLFAYELSKEVPGEMIATLWQNFNEWTNINPDKSIADFIKEQPAALAETAIATIVGGTTQIGAVKGVERIMGRAQAEETRAKKAEQTADILQNLVEFSAASKVRERDAGTFEAFMQDATQDGPIERVYINPAELQAAVST